jgi:predicted NAD/FAD-dependent oxidoreductase
MAQSVAIIGAGIAGLSCAQQLDSSGYAVTIFEKSARLCGRSATRIRGDHRFDHGAQYFTARHDPFKTFVERGLSEGSIGVWKPRSFTGDSDAPWFVGTPGMSSLGDLFSVRDAVRTNTLINEIRRSDDAWTVRGTSGETDFSETFDQVVVAIPSRQATDILRANGDPHSLYTAELNVIADEIAHIAMLPCWTVMLSVDKHFSARWPYDVLQTDGPDLDRCAVAWLANNSSKPLRPHHQETHDWVVQSSPSWAEARLEDDPRRVARELITEVEKRLGVELRPFVQDCVAHRWRFARVATRPATSGYRYSEDNRVGWCGDYLSSSRVESAYLSGLQLAERMITACL